MILVTPAFVALFALSTKLKRISNRYMSSLHAARAISCSNMATALYLRGFGSDERYVDVYRGMQASFEAFVIRPFELAFNVVAIGQPGERLPLPGSIRLYAPKHGDGWKKVVTDLIDHATIVVMLADVGQGVRWELEQFSHFEAGRKLVLVTLDHEGWPLPISHVEGAWQVILKDPDVRFPDMAQCQISFVDVEGCVTGVTGEGETITASFEKAVDMVWGIHPVLREVSRFVDASPTKYAWVPTVYLSLIALAFLANLVLLPSSATHFLANTVAAIHSSTDTSALVRR